MANKGNRRASNSQKLTVEVNVQEYGLIDVPSARSPKQMGPTIHRRCRDLPFLILFLAFWCGMGIVGFYAVRNGDINLLLIPQDTEGNYCGMNNTRNGTNLRDLSGRPFLYYLNMFNFPLTPAVCVNACPTELAPINMTNKICKYDTIPTTLDQLIVNALNGTCAPFLLPSVPVLNRCVPTNPIPAEYVKKITNATFVIDGQVTSLDKLYQEVQSYLFQAASDINNSWQWIVGGAGVALFICFLWLLFISLFAKPFVWISILGFNILSGALTIWLGFQYQEKAANYQLIPMDQRTNLDRQLVDGYLAGLIVCGCLFFIFLCVTVFLRKRIKIAVEVVKIAAKAVGAMPSVIGFPFFTWICMAGILFYYLWILGYLITIDNFNPITVFDTVQLPGVQGKYFIAYHTFGFLWGWAFFLGLGQVTIAGAIATYYWTMDKKNIQSLPVVTSFFRAIFYSAGSIALGSLLLAIVWTAEIIIYMIRRQVGKKSGNRLLKCFLACLACIFHCLEKIVKWVNKAAYINIAIEGTSFCTAAFHASGLLARNALRLIAVDFVSEYALFMGKVMIAGLAFVVAWFFFHWKQSELRLFFPYVPAILVALEAFIIAIIFMGVYNMAISTIFFSFLEDCEQNDGSDEKPYYMPKALRKLIH